MARVLCVEDEPSFREDIADFLRLQNFEVDEASNGEEALGRLQHTLYDLVLSDIYMPGLDGFGLLQEANKSANVPPFVFLTALAEKHDHVRGRMLGCDDYLAKPIDFDVLLSVVQTRVQKAHAVQNKYCYGVAEAQHQMADLAVHELATPVLEASELLQLWLFTQQGKQDAEMLRYGEAISSRLSYHVDQLTLLDEVYGNNAVAYPLATVSVDDACMHAVAMQLEHRFPKQNVKVMLPQTLHVLAEPNRLQRALTLLASPSAAEPEHETITLFGRMQHDSADIGVWFGNSAIDTSASVTHTLAACMESKLRHTLKGRMIALQFAANLARVCGIGAGGVTKRWFTL
jgi:DNA-binding response OmpR family regulator